jgi:glycosyltransferase involved in cell wall biosynthesis
VSIDPLVAVLIPVYGPLAPLHLTLESLLAARLPARLCTLVVDDGSAPPLKIDTVRYAPLGVRLVRLPMNQGIVAALNRGLELAREVGAAYVARLDAGDTVEPERLTKQLAFLENHADVGIVASDVTFVDERGQRLFRFEAPRTDEETRRRMRINCCLIHPSVMLRMSTLELAGGAYSADYPAAEDYELFLRLLSRSGAASIAESLTTAVASPTGISRARRRRQLVSRLRLQLRYFNPTEARSYAGIVLTLLFFVLPAPFLATLKRLSGISRY